MFHLELCLCAVCLCQHMTTTIEHLLRYHDQQRAAAGLSGPSRGIVWAHNSHLGDARHTVVSRSREWNVGQLVREQYGMAATFNIGFTTYDGTVSAAKQWGAERETMTVNPAVPGSYEDVMHRVAALPQRAEQKEEKHQSTERDFALLFRSNGQAQPSETAVRLLGSERRERAIGVQYVKRTELQSHYMVAHTQSHDALSTQYCHWTATALLTVPGMAIVGC